MKKIVFVLIPGFQLLDVAGPADVFSSANLLSGKTNYKLSFVSEDVSPISECGLPIRAQKLTSTFRAHTLFIPGALLEDIVRISESKSFMKKLENAIRSSQRVCSVCSGIFVSAQCGVYDGKKATTHWLGLGELKKRFPNIEVLDGPIYVKDGSLWSSAGVTAGIDLALAIVKEDLGAKIAAAVAKRLVVTLHRPGNQSQFSNLLELQNKGRDGLEDLVPWLRERISRQISVDEMASFCGLSLRTFHRRCKAIYDATPNELEELVRVHACKETLEDGRTPIKKVAADHGYSSAGALTAAFKKHFAITPQGYSKQMRGR